MTNGRRAAGGVFLPVLLAASLAAGQVMVPVTPPPSPAPGDTAVRAPITRADSVRVVRRHFNHREQLITGSVIMACLAGILVVMNNYNPQ